MERSRDIDDKSDVVVEVLYGERDPATVEMDDEMRAELESFGELRALYRDLVDEEPSSAVTAKLLAAAAAQAPSVREETADKGVWAWLVRVFRPIAMHPGLAAAASLVLVAGVAGMLYVTRTVDVAQPSVDYETTSPGRASEPASGAAPGGGEPALKAPEPAPPVDDEIPQEPPVVEPEPVDEQAKRESSKDAPRDRKSSGGKARIRASRLEGRTDSKVIPTPDALQADVAEGGFEDETAVTKPAPQSPPEPARRAAAEDRNKSKGAERDPAAGPSGGAAATAEEEQRKTAAPPKNQKKSEPSEAQRLHTKARTAAVRGDCKQALSLGQKIRKADSRYYDDVFLTDARIRDCRSPAKK